MTRDELVWGARMAWRNASRCPARSIWKKLTVFDKRHIDTADDMFHAICDHLAFSNNGGNIRPAITVFRQRTPGKVSSCCPLQSPHPCSRETRGCGTT